MAVVLLAMGVYGCGCEWRLHGAPASCAAPLPAVRHRACMRAHGHAAPPHRAPPVPAARRRRSPPPRLPGPDARSPPLSRPPRWPHADLGWKIRTGEDADEVAAAADLHPKVGAAWRPVPHAAARPAGPRPRPGPRRRAARPSLLAGAEAPGRDALVPKGALDSWRWA